MSTDPQQFYPNPSGPGHQQPSNFYIPSNGMEQAPYPMAGRNPGAYNPRLMNPQMANGFQQAYYPPHYLPPPFVAGNPRSMNSAQFVQLVRPQNETIASSQGFIPQYSQYPPGNTSMTSTTPIYHTTFFPPNYTMGPYQTLQPAQITNQQTMPQQSQYALPTGLPQQPPMHPPQQTHPQPMDQPLMPTSQPTMPQPSTHSTTEKRQRKPLVIVDPVSHKTVDLAPTPSTATSTTTNPPVASTMPVTNENRQAESSTDSAAANVKSTSDINKTQKQSEFRYQFAKLLSDNPNAQPDKNVNQQSGSNEDSSTKQPSTTAPQGPSSTSSSRSGSMSRPKSPTTVPSTAAPSTASKEPTTHKSSEQSQSHPGLPGIPMRTIADDKPTTKVNQDDNRDKRDRSDSQKQSDVETVETTEKATNELKSTSDDTTTATKSDEVSTSNRPDPQPTPPLSATASLECVTPPQTPTPVTSAEKSQAAATAAALAAANQRLRYDRNELLRIRDSSGTFPIPQLPDLDIVLKQRDSARSSHLSYTGTNSQGRINPKMHRQLSGTNHPSLIRYSNNQSNSTSDSMRGKPGIYLANEPDFGNRVENPYKPIDQSKIDASNKVLRDVKAILNKVTPQTYDKLQKQLESLEIDRYERLEGMINIFFSKAVDEPAFSFLYAKLCKQFQKKQVTVPGEDGKTVTHYFRQILLTRCQKEFENDYRQEIEYEKRKSEVEAITDEKKRKEENEKLEEDLVKAKRRKLGNIFFIGELFKLQMLTDTIMYDCIEYLLRDKTDEEALECLCRLLRTIGKELDVKASEKATNKSNLEKHYRELDNIVKEHKTSARIRFMIQDLVELRQAHWVARRAEAKPTTIDEIHEQERVKREQQEREQERERQQRRDQNRGTAIGSAYTGGNSQQYNDSRGSRGSGIKQQSSRNDEDRVDNRFNVNSLRQLQTTDKQSRGPLPINLAPQRTWAKGSGIEKKPEEDRSFAGRAGKPPAGPVAQIKGKAGSSQGGSSYPLQRQSSRELARENSQRDRENALQSLRKTTTGSGINSPVNVAGSSSMANSREGSRNVSREQSRNASRESSVSERASNAGLSTQISKSSTTDSSTVINPDPSNITFDEEKTQARVHSLIEEYTENYSETTDRPVKEALEDLNAFCTASQDQQALIVRELFVNVLEAKSRARKAVGHLLDAALNDAILLPNAFISGFKMVVEVVPDYAVDIPLIWQYIGEIIGAFIGAPSSNMALLKTILQCVPQDKSKQLFQYVIKYATEFSSRSRIQKFWQSSGFSLQDFVDAATLNDYDWLSDAPESEPSTPQSKESLSPRADPQLVKLFKSVNDQGTTVTDSEIITYIREHMDSNEKFYIRNIVLSYLEACLINRDPQKKIQEDIAKKRMTILNTIIEHKPEAEIQAVYAIQNFVNKLEHPPKMARLLFDIFYDEECVSEDAFFEWLKHPDQSETEGHAVVEMSTKDFFTWLQQAETEVEEGEEEES
ncbi:unnamed protein product [Adineta ricciae]|uniref:Eukaryotic translation initiation factor 4 gamma 3 n=1 Tax=Adineta ricciae TaxID=249248 RepID=A0A813XPG8_ADIRI|nr:unnamed protein product [Adineta ricciae]